MCTFFGNVRSVSVGVDMTPPSFHWDAMWKAEVSVVGNAPGFRLSASFFMVSVMILYLLASSFFRKSSALFDSDTNVIPTIRFCYHLFVEPILECDDVLSLAWPE